jgi:hypothetical protein
MLTRDIALELSGEGNAPGREGKLMTIQRRFFLLCTVVVPEGISSVPCLPGEGHLAASGRHQLPRQYLDEQEADW